MILKRILLLILFFTVAFAAKADDYYWVGDANGNGEWNHVGNWKVSGSPASSIPSSADNIFLDRAGVYTITIPTHASCRDFTVLGGSPRLHGKSNATYYLYVYGSVDILPTLTSVNNTVRFFFKSNSTATFKSNGAIWWHHMQVDKEGGRLTILDDLIYQYIDFIAGTLEFSPGITVNLEFFRSNTVTYGNRMLVLNNAYVTVKTDWLYTGANTQLNAGTSHIEMMRADNHRFYVEAVASHIYNKFSFINTLATTYNTQSDIKGLSAKEVEYTVAYRAGTNSLRFYGVVGDSVRIGTLKTNSRVDFNYAVVDSAEYKTIYSTFIGGRSRIKNLYIEGSGAFQDNIKVDTLALSYGQYYGFNQNQKYQIFDNFRLLGSPCAGPITFESGDDNVANMAEFVKTSGTLDIPYGYIRNIKTGGGAVFNCAGYNHNDKSVGWNFTDYVAAGKDLYWIGGGGYTYWNTPEAWSLTSGGAPANCVPSQYDNVFFDNNSGLTNADKNIRLRAGIRAFSKDLNFIGNPEYLPRLNIHNSRGFNIYGSLLLKPGANFVDIYISDSLRFLSSAPGNTITTNGQNLLRSSFNNPTGGWTLMDDLTMGNNHDIVFNQGTLNTNNKNVNYTKFYSINNGVRNLILGNSTLAVTQNGAGDWAWVYTGQNKTLDAGTSTILMINSHMRSDTLVTYNKILVTAVRIQSTFESVKSKYINLEAVPNNLPFRHFFRGWTVIDSLVSYRTPEFHGVCKIRNAQLFAHSFFKGSNNSAVLPYHTFDTIVFGDATLNYFNQGTTVVVNKKISSLTTGCNGYTYFTALRGNDEKLVPTATAKIQIPATETFQLNGAKMRWIEGLDGTFIAAGEDLGNNINWAFTPPITKDIYWVGGSGDWHDQAHWSGTSGGTGGFCLPSEYDNVIFDLNSNLVLTDSLNVYVPKAKSAVCKNMTWSGVLGVYKKLHVEEILYVHGSIDLQADVDYLVRYFRFRAYDNFDVETIKTNGAVITGYAIFGDVNRGAYGSWKLLDKLNMASANIKINGATITLSGHIQVYGTFDTDGHDVFARMYYGFNNSTSYWRNSTIEVYYRAVDGHSTTGIEGSLAKLYADSATLLVDQTRNETVNVRLDGSKVKKIVVHKLTIITDPEVNFYGNFTVDYLDAQSSYNTLIRGGITAKRIDAHKGMTFQQYAIVDTFNVGLGDYVFTNNKTYNFGIIQDLPSKCVSQRGFNAKNAKLNVAERVSLTNTDFTNTNVVGVNTPFAVTGTTVGTNTGLTITEPSRTTLYLVSNTATVYWDDTTAWSFTPRGAPSGCFPGRWTNVVIDDDSYVGNPTLLLELRPGLRNIYNKCYNFTSTRTAKTKYYTDRDYPHHSLWVYGSIDFNSTSELNFDHIGAPLYLMAETPQTLNINYFRGNVYFQGTGTGSWTLQRDFINDLTVNKVTYFRSGDLILNGYNLGATQFMEDGANTKAYSIDMNNSDIYGSQFLAPTGVLKNTENTNMYLTNRVHHAFFRSKQGTQYKFNKLFFDITYGTNSAGSFATIETDFAADTLLVRNSSNRNDVYVRILDTIDVKVFKTMRLNANTPAVRTLLLDSEGNYGSFYSDVLIVNINGNNSFDTLDIAQNGPTYTLAAGTTQTIKQAAYMSGSPCKFTTFRSNTPGSLANIVVPRPMTVDFDIFAYIRAGSYDGTPGNVLTAERNSTQETGSFTENITFINKPKTLIGLGEDLTACFRDFPYTISSAGFFAGSAATYEWRNSANQVVGREPNLVITVPGKYSIKVDYDPLYTCNQADEVTILRGAPITPVIVWDTIRPICHKDSLVLTISNPVGSGYEYAMVDTADKNVIVTQISPIFDNAKAGTYYLIVDSANCFSSTRLVSIREPYRAGIADDIIISDTSTCYNTSVTLSPKAGIGLDSVFYWYSDAALTNPIPGIGADGVFTTPLLTSPTTYYITTSSDTICENIPGNAKAVNVTIRALPTLSLANTTLVSCAGNDGIVTVTALLGRAPFEYSKDGTTWQASSIFNAMPAGTHKFWVKDANGCISLDEEIILEAKVTANPNANSYSDGPATYGVAENKLKECIYLGSLNESKIQLVPVPSVMANTALNDDGIVITEIGGYTDLSQASFELQANGDLVAKVKASNHHTSPGIISGWIDFDRNGVYDDMQAVETILANTNNGEFTLTWYGAAAEIKNGVTYMRLRITSHPNYFDPVAIQANGETEDYRLNFNLVDIEKTVSNNKAVIGDTLQYTLTVTNNTNTDLANVFVFDPLPIDTKFHEADNGGVLTPGFNFMGTVIDAVTWAPFNLLAGTTVTRTFKVVVNEIPHNDSIANVAFSTFNNDTISSADNCDVTIVEVKRLIAEDDCFAVLKNGIIPQAEISLNDTDSLRLFVRDTILHAGGNTRHGGLAILNLTPKGSMEYTAGNNYVGLDTVNYRIKTLKDSADAKAVIAVIAFKSDKYMNCPGNTVKVEVEHIDNVVFEWFTVSDTTLITSGDFADITLGAGDTVVMVKPIINGCDTKTYFEISIGIIPAPKMPDIRVLVCPLPAQNINLSSYLDSIEHMTYTWSAVGSSPAIAAGTTNTTGTISTATMNPRHHYMYNYDYSNNCGTGKSMLIFKGLNEGIDLPLFDTIIVCKDNVGELNLNRIMGLEVSGTWDYGTPLNPDATLSTYVDEKSITSNYSGAYIFDAISAYAGTSNVYLYPGGYLGDMLAKMFKFNYTTAATCGPSQTREIVIIVTSKFFN